MAHPLLTQTLGNFDLPPYINGNAQQSIGNLSYTAIPHEWMMMNGRIAENIRYYSNSHGRDGLSYGGGEVSCTGYIWGEKNSGLRNGDWDGGGIFLEQCHSKDCFFGCGGDHFYHTTYDGLYDSYSKDWEIDDDQVGIANFKEHAFGKPHVLESNKFARSTRYFPLN
jgi:hypothetical protein